MPTVAPYDLGERVECAAFVADEPVFALADGRVTWPLLGRTVEAHDGLLCATPTHDDGALLAGGEDGRVTRITAEGAVPLIEVDGAWFDAIAAGPDGAVAAVAGRDVHTLDRIGGERRRFGHPRAVEGVTFAPKGKRVAVARYDGVTLHWLAGHAAPAELQWPGAHTGITVSPDGRYVVTTMAENALHGWRIDGKGGGKGGSKGKADTGHLRMSGYPGKPRTLSWSARGRWLASDGAPAAVLWSFGTKEGPQGKVPKQLGTRSDTLVTALACHPTQDVVAIGYRDGLVAAVRIEDAAESLLRDPGGSPVTALAWDRYGDRLVFGTDGGQAGMIDIREG